jgi:hypothetical protein
MPAKVIRDPPPATASQGLLSGDMKCGSASLSVQDGFGGIVVEEVESPTR